MDNQEKMKIIMPFIILAICVPIIVDFFIFGNSFPSNISNESFMISSCIDIICVKTFKYWHRFTHDDKSRAEVVPKSVHLETE